MGSAGLIEIKRRLKSVENTKKITKAMGLVATSKLRKCRKELSTNTKFEEVAEDTMKVLANFLDDNMDIPYFKENDSKCKLYILISSDTGLCAGYNGNVVNFLDYIIKKENENCRIISVGSKGISYLRRNGLETINEFVDIPDVPTIREVKMIYESGLHLFLNEEVSSVEVVYTEFISPLKQEVKIERLLPIKKESKESGEFFVEPNLEVVLKDSLDIYLKGKLRSLMISAKCSEQSARMQAMDSATSNANDIIQALNIQFNRIRQSIITQEISEIVGGAEAQK